MISVYAGLQVLCCNVRVAFHYDYITFPYCSHQAGLTGGVSMYRNYFFHKIVIIMLTL